MSEQQIDMLWKVFMMSNLKRNPNDPETMRQRDFVEVFTKDLKLSSPPMRAELEIMYTSEASNHPEKKFKFSCFASAVAKVVIKKKSTTKSQQEQVEEFLTKYVAPMAAKRKGREVTAELETAGPMLSAFISPLKSVFQFFATLPTQYEKETLKRHGHRDDINAMTQSLHYSEFLSCCSMFNLSSSVGTAVKALSPSALASTFMDSIKVSHVDSVGGLTFEEFVEALVRCSLIFYKGDDSVVGTTNKITRLFAHMSNNLETSVPRLLGVDSRHESSGAMAGLTKGGRDSASSGALLQHGTHEFSRLIWELMREGNGEGKHAERDSSLQMNVEEKVWNIFLHFNIANNPRDWSAMRKRELVLLLRSRKGIKVMEAEINVIHSSEAGRNANRRLEFTNFLAALTAIARKAYKEKDGDKAIQKLLMGELLKDESLLHKKMDISKDDMAVGTEWISLFDTPLKRMFSFFSDSPSDHEQKELGRHLATDAIANISQQTCSMTWSSFLNFAACGNLSSGTGTAITALSLNALAGCFVDSIGVWGHNDLGGLTYHEFTQVLIRCALIFNFEADDTTRARLEKLFLHMCNNFQTSVPRIINAGNERVGAGGQTAGGRSTSTSTGLLIKGTREFNAILHRESKFINVGTVESEGGGSESVFKFGEGGGEGGSGGLMNLGASLRKGLP